MAIKQGPLDMIESTLTELLERNELDVRQERIKRPDSRIWYLVEKELGGAYVIGSLASGGGAVGSSAMGARSTPAKSIDANALKLQREKFIEGFVCYDKLAKLKEAEIDERCSDLRRSEMECKQQAYITTRRLNADFPYWLKMATWTLEEGAALIHGLEPRTIKPSNRDSTKEPFPILKSWLECREHAFRALRAGQLKDNSKPIEFLTWARSLDYPIPEGLQGFLGRGELVAQRAKDELSWKTPARAMGEEVLKKHPQWSVEQISKKVHEMMTDKHRQGEKDMTGRGGKVVTAETVKRHALKGLKATRHSGNAH